MAALNHFPQSRPQPTSYSLLVRLARAAARQDLSRKDRPAADGLIGRAGEPFGGRGSHIRPPDRSPSWSDGVEQLCGPKRKPLTQTVEVLADQAVLCELVGDEQLGMGEGVGEHASIEGDVRAIGDLQQRRSVATTRPQQSVDVDEITRVRTLKPVVRYASTMARAAVSKAPRRLAGGATGDET